MPTYYIVDCGEPFGRIVLRVSKSKVSKVSKLRLTMSEDSASKAVVLPLFSGKDKDYMYFGQGFMPMPC